MTTNGNGNGKTSPAVIAAQRTVEQAEHPLKELDRKIVALQEQLSTAQTAAANLISERDKAEQALVDDLPHASERLRDVAAKEAETAARVRGLSTKLNALQTQRPALDAAWQQAQVILQEAIFDDEFNKVEEEISKARFQLAQSQEQTVQKQKIVNELSDRLRLLASQKRDSEWRRTRAAAHAHHTQHNSSIGFERVRQGF